MSPADGTVRERAASDRSGKLPNGERRAVGAGRNPRSPGRGRTHVPGARLAVRQAGAGRRLGVHGHAGRRRGSRPGSVPSGRGCAPPLRGRPSLRAMVLHDPAQRGPKRRRRGRSPAPRGARRERARRTADGRGGRRVPGAPGAGGRATRIAPRHAARVLPTLRAGGALEPGGRGGAGRERRHRAYACLPGSPGDAQGQSAVRGGGERNKYRENRGPLSRPPVGCATPLTVGAAAAVIAAVVWRPEVGPEPTRDTSPGTPYALAPDDPLAGPFVTSAAAPTMATLMATPTLERIQ